MRPAQLSRRHVVVVALLSLGLLGVGGAPGLPRGVGSGVVPQDPEDPVAREPRASAEVWRARRSDACAGLTVRWGVPLEKLGDLVGPLWRPTAGQDGRGRLSLFGVRCDNSMLEGVATGPFQLAALLTGVESAPGVPEIFPVPPGAAVPAVVGAGGHGIVEFFRRHHFAVFEGDIELHVEATPDAARAGLRVVLPAGRITVLAHLEPALEPFEASGTALMATGEGVVAGFSGPESAARRSTGSATVTASGDTWISRLDLGPTPDSLALDTDLVWGFTFWSREIPFR